MASQTIYVELLGEAVDVWAPVQAEAQPDGTFRLPEQAPDDQTWKFAPGSRVRCEHKTLSDGPALVATEPAD